MSPQNKTFRKYPLISSKMAARAAGYNSDATVIDEDDPLRGRAENKIMNKFKRPYDKKEDEALFDLVSPYSSSKHGPLYTWLKTLSSEALSGRSSKSMENRVNFLKRHGNWGRRR